MTIFQRLLGPSLDEAVAMFPENLQEPVATLIAALKADSNQRGMWVYRTPRSVSVPKNPNPSRKKKSRKKRGLRH